MQFSHIIIHYCFKYCCTYFLHSLQITYQILSLQARHQNRQCQSSGVEGRVKTLWAGSADWLCHDTVCP